MKTAIIAGYTGLIGRQLLELLLKNDIYSKVITVGRRKVDIQHNKLVQEIINFDEFDLDIDQVDDVFCCLGTTMKVADSKEKFRLVDFQYPVTLANWGNVKGATNFLLVSSMGADASSKIFYNRVKGEVESAIASIDYNRIDFFRPSLLLGLREDTRIGESIGKFLMKVFAFAFIGPFKDYKAIESERIARAMVSFAAEDTPGTYTHLSSELQNY